MKNFNKFAVVVAAAAIALSGAVATPAAASGTGTAVGSGGTLVSIYVDGTYNRVNSLEVGVLYPVVPYGSICNGRATGTGTRTTGAAWSKTWGQYSGCLFASWASKTSVGLDFKSSTVMRGSAYHDGMTNSGRPTVAIQ